MKRHIHIKADSSPEIRYVQKNLSFDEDDTTYRVYENEYNEEYMDYEESECIRVFSNEAKAIKFARDYGYDTDCYMSVVKVYYNEDIEEMDTEQIWSNF